VAPPIVALLSVTYGWRGAFVALGMVSLVWVITWFWYFRDDPRDHRGVTPEDLAALPPHIDKATMAQRRIPWRRLVLRMAPVTLTYFCYGWSLWLYLNWLPQFFLQGYGLDIKQAAFFSAGAFFAGVVGDTLGGVISDRILKRTGNVQLARLSVILFGMVGGVICLSLVFTTRDLDTIALLVSAGFFFLELIVGPIWSIPMDIAPQYVGTATGLMNIGSATAAIVSPLAFGYIVDLTGNWVLPFAGSIGMLLVGMVLCFTMHPDRPFAAEPAAA
jgi:nitrate/nitrite transporter NarK